MILERKMKVIEEQLLAAIQNSKEMGVDLAELKELLTLLYKEDNMMENVIELQHVNKAFKGFELKDLSISVKKGFVTGFIGGNGAGKSTTIKLIMNLLQPDSGTISIFGLNYKKHEKEIKQRIGFVFDKNVFYENITLAEMKKIIKPAYKNWDDTLFNQYVEMFELPLKEKVKNIFKRNDDESFISNGIIPPC